MHDIATETVFVFLFLILVFNCLFMYVTLRGMSRVKKEHVEIVFEKTNAQKTLLIRVKKLDIKNKIKYKTEVVELREGHCGEVVSSYYSTDTPNEDKLTRYLEFLEK